MPYNEFDHFQGPPFRGNMDAFYYSPTEKNYDGTAKLIKYTCNVVNPVSEAFARRYKSLIFDRQSKSSLDKFRFW